MTNSEFDPAGIESEVRRISGLCLECGLCCRGALFSWLPVRPREVPRLGHTEIRLHKSGNASKRKIKYSAHLPCSCHDGAACLVYESRPATCRDYSCNLLDKTVTGELPATEALELIRQAKSLFEELEQASVALQGARYRKESLRQFLDDFCTRMKPRAALSPLNERDRAFAYKSYEYLRITDRHFNDSELAAEYCNLVAAALAPEYAFEDGCERDVIFEIAELDLKIRIIDSPELEELLVPFLPQYTVTVSANADGARLADCTIWKSGDGYKINSAAHLMLFSGKGRTGDATDVVASLMSELPRLYSWQQADTFALKAPVHGGGGGITVQLGSPGSSPELACLELCRLQTGDLWQARTIFNAESGLAEIINFPIVISRKECTPAQAAFIEQLSGTQPCLQNDTTCVLLLPQAEDAASAVELKDIRPLLCAPQRAAGALQGDHTVGVKGIAMRELLKTVDDINCRQEALFNTLAAISQNARFPTRLANKGAIEDAG